MIQQIRTVRLEISILWSMEKLKLMRDFRSLIILLPMMQRTGNHFFMRSINDVSQLTCMIDKAHGYGYRNLGFILDRGYFSRKNLSYMEQNGYNFLIMVKGMKEFISDIILENHGKFENSRAKYNDRYDVYGTTIKQYLYEGDQKKRNIHIYYSDGRAYGEKQEIKQKI